MPAKPALAAAASAMLIAGLSLSQSGSKAVMANYAAAKWVHEPNDPPGSEGVTLRDNPQTGALELLVRYPAGHVFRPHWHTANERMVLIEGRMSLRQGDSPETILEPAGFAFLPAREVQRTACISKTRCTFSEGTRS